MLSAPWSPTFTLRVSLWMRGGYLGTKPLLSQRAVTRSASFPGRPRDCPQDGRAVVCFTGDGDLHLRGNPAVDAAATAAAWAFILVLGARELRRSTPRRLRVLHGAAKRLHRRLHSLREAELVVLVDPSVASGAEVAARYALSIDATDIYVHYSAALGGGLCAGLQALSPNIRIHGWTAPLRNAAVDSADFRDYALTCSDLGFKTVTEPRWETLPARIGHSQEAVFDLSNSTEDSLLAIADKSRHPASKAELDPVMDACSLVIDEEGLALGRVALCRLAHRRTRGVMRDVAERREWHRLLALRDVFKAPPLRNSSEVKIRYWSWHGHLVRYLVSESGKEGLPMLLIHGFGCDAGHFTRLLDCLATAEANAGPKKCYAIDLLGFGHAAKPPAQYSVALWTALLKDFGACVIGKPFVVGGNSIGAYFALSLAASVRGSLIRGIVLIDVCGPEVAPEEEGSTQRSLDNSDSSMASMEFALSGAIAASAEGAGAAAVAAAAASPTAPFVARLLDVASSALLAVGRLVAGVLLRTVYYPVRPEAADDLLIAELLRNSHDPGVPGVLAAAAVMPPLQSLESLVAATASRPMLALHGEEDRVVPCMVTLERVRSASAGTACCYSIPAAGHCPHDEAPERVAELVISFLGRLEEGSNCRGNACLDIVM